MAVKKKASGRRMPKLVRSEFFDQAMAEAERQGIAPHALAKAMRLGNEKGIYLMKMRGRCGLVVFEKMCRVLGLELKRKE